MLFTLITLTVVWWTYRRTYPPVAGWYRILLLILRTLTVLAAGLLVFEPLITVSHNRVRQERLAVLVDLSASMLLPSGAQGGDSSLSRLDRGREIVEEAAVKDSFPIFGFGEELVTLVGLDSLADKVEDRTDLSAALKKLKERGGEPWDRIYLVTDGVINAGADPLLEAEGLPPVEMVMVGAPPRTFDLALSALEQIHSASSGGKLDLELSLTVFTADSAGSFNGNAAMCDFFLEGKKAGEERIDLEGVRGRNIARRVSLPAPGPGVHWLRAVLRPLPGEWTAINNERLLKVEVAESKRKMMLVTNAPDWDFTFFKRALSQEEEWEVSSLIVLRDESGKEIIRGQESDGRFTSRGFPTAKELEDLDLVLLHGELAGFDRSFLIRVGERASGGGFALIFWPSGELDTGKLPRALDSYLPFLDSPVSLIQVKAPDSPSSIFTQDRYNIFSGPGYGTALENLPPVEWVYRSLPLKAPVAVLARTGRRILSGGKTAEKGEALLTAQPAGGTRVAAVLGQGLWRWQMLSQDAAETKDRRYYNLWESLVEWLMSGEKGAEMVLRPRRGVFHRGEKVILEGEIRTDSAQSKKAAPLTLIVWREEEGGARDTVARREVVSASPGGLLRIELGLLQPGIYGYQGTVSSGYQKRKSSGSFAVEKFSPEMAQIQPDTSILGSLVRVTGGKISQDYLAAARLAPGNKQETVALSSRLAYNSRIYFLLIFLLAAEWILRRKKALP